ncbi:MAG: agmatinase [Planctomycetes bacterium]|nr:agmatinase [Planctomycetota bacterium]MBI3844573.1 agmatinase [Planctomycetota bacterium]
MPGPQRYKPGDFLGIPKGEEGKPDAPFVIFPVSYEATVTYQRGTGRGAKAAIEASHQVELWDEELGMETYRVGIRTVDGFSSTAKPERALVELRRRYAVLLQPDRVIAMIGGEHSITLPAVQACAEVHRGLSVLQIDAHADLRDEYEGTKLGHGCVMRRASEICPIVQVGIRSLSLEEETYRQKGSITTFFAHRDRGRDVSDAVLAALTDTVYVTIDLDGFDPSLVPGTGTPEPGGLGWAEVTHLLRKVAANRRIVGFDVVELLPLGSNAVSDFVAARLTYRMIGYVVRGRDVAKL